MLMENDAIDIARPKTTRKRPRYVMYIGRSWTRLSNHRWRCTDDAERFPRADVLLCIELVRPRFNAGDELLPPRSWPSSDTACAASRSVPRSGTMRRYSRLGIITTIAIPKSAPAMLKTCNTDCATQASTHATATKPNASTAYVKRDMLPRLNKMLFIARRAAMQMIGNTHTKWMNRPIRATVMGVYESAKFSEMSPFFVSSFDSKCITLKYAVIRYSVRIDGTARPIARSILEGRRRRISP
mmetsp:Transcript_32944/g.101776  ORF Transcript_32944/g.101776 Transcript_32944/m.101776 type:complete len:242 (-) Transcript_32944:811-1536(-)